ncbi:TPA: hypothetical protein DIV55_02270 [Patescibacteria group bacterium]|nr:hypothetical protein [Patescibacteria group bacterium]
MQAKISLLLQILKKDITLLTCLIVVYTAIFGTLAVVRHYRFESQGWDLGFYEQTIWKYAHGEIARSSFSGKLDLADRFRPAMLLFVIPYALVPTTETLLILQALVIALACFPLFYLAKKITRHRNFSLIVCLAYLFFIGTQSLLLNDFHEVCLLPLALIGLLYFLETNKFRAASVMLILTLMVREYVGFLVVAIGVSALLTHKPRLFAFLMIAIGAIWSLVVIQVIMPALGQNMFSGFLGGQASFTTELIQLITHPLHTISLLLTPVTKLKTMFVSFAAFGFLPVLYPPLLVPIAMQLALRFLDLTHPYRWTLYFQYSADLAGLMAIGAIYGSKQLLLFIKKIRIISYTTIACLLFAITIFEQLFLSVPLKLLIQPNYFVTEAYMENNQALLQLIPPDTSVATQNSLAAHLSRRDHLYLLPDTKNADYVMFDLHPNQSAYNFSGRTPEEIRELMDGLLANKEYLLVAQQGDAYVLKSK